MKRLELVNTNSQENNNTPGRYTLSSIHIGDNEADEIIQIHDKTTGLNNMLDSDMQLVFENWYEIICEIKKPASCLAVQFSDGSVNLVFPDMTLALDNSHHAIDYYQAYENMIFFFDNIEGSAGNLIAYDITKRCVVYVISDVTIDYNYHTIPYAYGELLLKYFYYIDALSSDGKIIDITTGRCVLENVPKDMNITINYSSDSILLISFDFDTLEPSTSFKEKWLVDIKSGNKLILNDEESESESAIVDYEFKFEDSNYVVLINAHNSNYLVIRIDENGNLSKLTEGWVPNFVRPRLTEDRRFVFYSKGYPYYGVLYDLKTLKPVIDDVCSIDIISKDILHVHQRIEGTSICGKLFSISGSKFILDNMNIDGVTKTNDDDILIVCIDSKPALFSISKEKLISTTFSFIDNIFDSKGYIEVQTLDGQNLSLHKSGNVVY